MCDIYGKNNIIEISKNQLDIDLKIVMLDYLNNYIE